jgi:threonine dehydrogenase-like Zn-dependent dehydrogenase
MRAFVMREIGCVGFVDKPVPDIGPNDAVVRTTRALICTSDSHTVSGGIGPRQDPHLPVPGDGTGLRGLGQETRRRHQAAHHVLTQVLARAG